MKGVRTNFNRLKENEWFSFTENLEEVYMIRWFGETTTHLVNVITGAKDQVRKNWETEVWKLDKPTIIEWLGLRPYITSAMLRMLHCPKKDSEVSKPLFKEVHEGFFPLRLCIDKDNLYIFIGEVKESRECLQEILEEYEGEDFGSLREALSKSGLLGRFTPEIPDGWLTEALTICENFDLETGVFTRAWVYNDSYTDNWLEVLLEKGVVTFQQV